jgi:hypothetical protein
MLTSALNSKTKPAFPSMDNGVLDDAPEYARRGLSVFSCNPANKAPLVKNGFKAATCDEQQIREWWTTWPQAMIGVPTGPASGIDVIDIDLRGR